MMTFKYNPILTLVAGLFIEAEDRTFFLKKYFQKVFQKVSCTCIVDSVHKSHISIFGQPMVLLNIWTALFEKEPWKVQPPFKSRDFPSFLWAHMSSPHMAKKLELLQHYLKKRNKFWKFVWLWRTSQEQAPIKTVRLATCVKLHPVARLLQTWQITCHWQVFLCFHIWQRMWEVSAAAMCTHASKRPTRPHTKTRLASVCVDSNSNSGARVEGAHSGVVCVTCQTYQMSYYDDDCFLLL